MSIRLGVGNARPTVTEKLGILRSQGSMLSLNDGTTRGRSNRTSDLGNGVADSRHCDDKTPCRYAKRIDVGRRAKLN